MELDGARCNKREEQEVEEWAEMGGGGGEIKGNRMEQREQRV